MNREIPLARPDIGEREREAVMTVLKSRWLSMGPAILEFERVMADYVGVKHAVAVNSGTSGLHLVVRGLGLSEGDEVITTPFSFVASANCLLYEKVKPVFVDIDPLTLNINVGLIEQKITDRTRGILPVHVFGHPADMDVVAGIAEKYGLLVIEDACEALGSTYNGKAIGTDSDAAVLAFYPNKQITTGEGGIIITNNQKLADICSSMRNQGRCSGGGWYDHCMLGYNCRMSEMNAALGCAQMARLKEILDKRERVAKLYKEKLRVIDGITLPYVASGVHMSWFVYVIQLAPDIDRDYVIEELGKKGIGCRAYFQPIHLQPFYRQEFGYKPGDFPVTESVAATTLALPFYNNLTEEEIDYVAESLNNILA